MDESGENNHYAGVGCMVYGVRCTILGREATGWIEPYRTKE
jgi:hypothetical protein